MGELERIKKSLIGQPVPYHSANEQACEVCADINDVLRDHNVPEAREQGLQSGDEVIFFTSRPAEGEGDTDASYSLSVGVNHRYHHGEYGMEFTLDRGTKDRHDALVTAVVEKTGFDFGKEMANRFEVEYKPDVEADALTLAQVDVMMYSSPQWGEESKGIEAKEPSESDYATPLKLNATWPAELQKAVYEYIREHR